MDILEMDSDSMSSRLGRRARIVAFKWAGICSFLLLRLAPFASSPVNKSSPVQSSPARGSFFVVVSKRTNETRRPASAR